VTQYFTHIGVKSRLVYNVHYWHILFAPVTARSEHISRVLTGTTIEDEARTKTEPK
jgi:hypothetical protein